MTSPPGNYPPLDPVAIQEASNWAAGERRSTPRWLVWLIAIPSAAILLLPIVLAISRGDDAYDIGRATGETVFALLIALVIRAAYVFARRRPWRSALSPWLFPLAVLVLIVSSFGRALPDATERQDEPSPTLSADSFVAWQPGHQ
jgi:amino acid transporter